MAVPTCAQGPPVREGTVTPDGATHSHTAAQSPVEDFVPHGGLCALLLSGEERASGCHAWGNAREGGRLCDQGQRGFWQTGRLKMDTETLLLKRPLPKGLSHGPRGLLDTNVSLGHTGWRCLVP